MQTNVVVLPEYGMQGAGGYRMSPDTVENVCIISEIKNKRSVFLDSAFDVRFGRLRVTNDISGFKKQYFNRTEQANINTAANRKFLYFNAAVSNISDKDSEYYVGQLMNKTGRGNTSVDFSPLFGATAVASYVEDDSSAYGKFCFVHVKAGETKNIVLGWIADSNADTDSVYYFAQDYTKPDAFYAVKLDN